MYQLFCDAGYVGNMGLELLAGQNFPNVSTSGERYILVNEEFLRMRQIPKAIDALGKTYFVEGRELEVIGVLKNFHFAPVQTPIQSFFLRTDESKYTYANLEMATVDLTATLATMETIWNRLSVRKFEAHLFDDEMEEMFYRFYRALLKMIGFLGLIAISITLGLLGMVMYTIEPRAKEVGIRKVGDLQHHLHCPHRPSASKVSPNVSSRALAGACCCICLTKLGVVMAQPGSNRYVLCNCLR